MLEEQRLMNCVSHIFIMKQHSRLDSSPFGSPFSSVVDCALSYSATRNSKFKIQNSKIDYD